MSDLIFKTTTQNVADGKGRSFRAQLLAHIEVPGVLPSREAEFCPAWALLGGSHEEIRAFAANLQMGYSAKCGDTVLQYAKKEFLYTYTSVPGEGTIVNVFHGDLCAFEAPVAPERLRFLMILDAATVAANKWDREAAAKHVKKCGLSAYMAEETLGLVPHFAAYLDRRCRLPLPRHYKFFSQLLASMIQSEYASRSGGPGGSAIKVSGLAEAGLAPVLLVNVKHEDFKTLCALEVQRYVEKGGKLLWRG